MNYAPVPHFDLPFRYENLRAAVVQQDTKADVTNCVEATVRTVIGTRAWVPTFGIDDDTFTQQPVNTQKLSNQIRRNEPRAILNLKQRIPSFDVLADYIVVGVQNL